MAEAAENYDQNLHEVIIIGAGMSGLSAANTLVKSGITNFKILEARNKIGGRIEAVETGQLKLELGANYIHGILGNPMYELALVNGLIDITYSPKAHNVVAAMEDGSQIPFSVLEETYEAYICFLKRCEEYFLSQYLPPQGISSVGEHISLEAAIYLEKITNSKEKKMKQLIFNSLLKRETCITGCDDMNEVDLMELGSYNELQGGNITLPGGYSSILDPFASEIPTENIMLNHPVVHINWKGRDNTGFDYFFSSAFDSGIDLLVNGEANNDSDSDKTVTGDTPSPRSSVSSRSSVEKILKEESKQDFLNEKISAKLSDISHKKENETVVEVTCENGAKFCCHHVICTIPLGVLKEKAATLFSPKLPKEKLDSINKLSFGTVNKIFLEYSRPFLKTDVSEILLLWDNEDTGLDINLEMSWFKKIYSFTKLSETLILGWISGKEARYMETLPSSLVGEKCTEILRIFLNDPYIPLPKFCTYSKWHSQEFFRGSYTSIAVGASQRDIKRVAQPLCQNSQQKKPILLFAGEHTHSSFYSTVHGAYLSGQNAASILLLPNVENDLQEQREE